MSTLEELKKTWTEKENKDADPSIYTQASLGEVIRNRVRIHTNSSFKYFWASFTLQIIVYALLSHVIIKYGQNSKILYFAIAGIVMYIPFTIMLMRKFKKLATEKLSQQQNMGNSLYDYILRQQAMLRSFYVFKKWYEYFLTPLSCAIGVWLVFELYMPGGVQGHWLGAVIIFIISLLSCIVAIYSENKKSFILPIKQLQTVLDEFEQKEYY